MSTQDELTFHAAQEYLKSLRHGTPHPVGSVQDLRSCLSSVGKTLDDLETSEEELEECILRGRKMAAVMFLEYVERNQIDADVILHFFPVTLRHGTKHYKEVVKFLYEVAQECRITLGNFELPSDAFNEFIRSCYRVIAFSNMNYLVELKDIAWLRQFEVILAEGELSLERDMRTTRATIDGALARVRDHWEMIARDALTHFQSNILTITNSVDEYKKIVMMAQHQGGVSLAMLGTSADRVEALFKRFDLYQNLRANASNN